MQLFLFSLHTILRLMLQCVILVIALCLLLPIYATEGMFPTFMGVPAAGRGGVDLGVASDPTCINTNPGGLGFLHGKMIEFSGGGFYPNISFSNSANNSDSYFELIPYGSFAVSWDSPEQTLQVFTDPWLYTFGGTPKESEYLYVSGGQPMPNHEPKNQSSALLEFVVPQDISSLQLTAQGQDCQISDIRLIVDSAHVLVGQSTASAELIQPGVDNSQNFLVKTALANQHVFFVSTSMPDLPLHAKVEVIAVHFTWQTTLSRASIQLYADEKNESLSEQTVVAGQSGYLALAWTKDTQPALVKVCAPEGIKIDIREVLVGYRQSAKMYWEKIAPDKDWLVANSESSANVNSAQSTSHSGLNSYTIFASQQTITHATPFTLSLSNILANIRSNTPVKLVYYYSLDHKQPSCYLSLTVQNQTQILAHNEHKKTARESSKPIPICQRSADHEEPHLGRSSGFKFGFGIFPQAGARYTIKTKSDDFFTDGVESRTDLMFVSIAPAIAYRFNDSLSLGISLNFNLENLELDGLVMQSSLILAGKPIEGTNTTFGQYLIAARDINNIKGEIDSQYLTGFGIGGRIGLLWKLHERLQLGLMYTPKTIMMPAKGKVTLDFNRHFKQIDVASIVAIVLPNKGQNGFSGDYDMELEFDLPQQAGLGLSWLLTDNLLVSADFRWINYSNTQFVLKAKVNNGSNADLNALVGGSGTTVKLPIGWRDQYVAAIGLVWQSSPNWILRAGYNYCNNPVPEKYLNPQLAAISEHHVTMGGTYIVDRNLSVHAAVECALPNTLESGNINLVHEKYANSKIEMFSIGVVMGMTWRF